MHRFKSFQLDEALTPQPATVKESIDTMTDTDVGLDARFDVKKGKQPAVADVKKDHDPVVAQYDVFIKPQLEGDRKIFILQFPNREKSKPYDAKHGCPPIELRVKPKAGMVELDVPLDVYRNYDRAKGIKWGEAIRKSEMAKGGGSHGLPGGFGIGGAAPVARGRGRGEAEEGEDQERLLANYDRAVEDGHVLRKQTLGGQFVAKNSTSPIYMVGTFTNSIALLILQFWIAH